MEAIPCPVPAHLRVQQRLDAAADVTTLHTFLGNNAAVFINSTIGKFTKTRSSKPASKSDYYDGGMHRYDENQLFRKGPSGPCWWNRYHLNSSTVASLLANTLQSDFYLGGCKILAYQVDQKEYKDRTTRMYVPGVLR